MRFFQFIQFGFQPSFQFRPAHVFPPASAHVCPRARLPARSSGRLSPARPPGRPLARVSRKQRTKYHFQFGLKIGRSIFNPELPPELPPVDFQPGNPRNFMRISNFRMYLSILRRNPFSIRIENGTLFSAFETLQTHWNQSAKIITINENGK